MTDEHNMTAEENGSQSELQAKNTSPEQQALIAELSAAAQSDRQQPEAESADASGDGHHHHHHHHHHHDRHHRRRHHHRHHHHKKKQIKRLLLIAGVLMLLGIAVGAGLVFSMYHSGREQVVDENISITAPSEVRLGDDGRYVIYQNERYNYKKDIIPILFLGVDICGDLVQDKNDSKKLMADVITLFAIDKEDGVINVINVPRDIITDVGVYSPAGGFVGLEKQAIAAAYAYGDGRDISCINTEDAVSRLFYNLPIKTYVSLNITGISTINDSIGGVDVVSPETVDQFVEGERYHLVGETASDFVRMRSKDRADANLLRNERQKIFFKEFVAKVVAETRKDIQTPLRIKDIAEPYSCTNLNADRITYLSTEFIVNRDMKFVYSSVPVEVAQVGDNAENYVKEKEFYELFLKLFYQKAK